MSRSNTSKIAQYVDRVIYLGRRNLLFRVDIKHLYSIWNLCKTEEDYRYALTATNHFYNFGRQLTPEGLNKLFVTSLRCNQSDESISIISGSSNWLKKPPNLQLIYVLLNDLISKGDFNRVFKLFKIIRTSWQIPLTKTLYDYVISFMLTIKDNSFQEAMMVYGDSDVMGVKLNEETHCKVLEHCLKINQDLDMCRVICLYIINRMFKELERFNNPKTYYLLSWFSFRFKDQFHKFKIPGLTHHIKDWRLCFENSINMSLLLKNKLEINKNFFEETNHKMESLLK